MCCVSCVVHLLDSSGVDAYSAFCGGVSSSILAMNLDVARPRVLGSSDLPGEGGSRSSRSSCGYNFGIVFLAFLSLAALMWGTVRRRVSSRARAFACVCVRARARVCVRDDELLMASGDALFGIVVLSTTRGASLVWCGAVCDRKE